METRWSESPVNMEAGSVTTNARSAQHGPPCPAGQAVCSVPPQAASARGGIMRDPYTPKKSQSPEYKLLYGRRCTTDGSTPSGTGGVESARVRRERGRD